MCVRVYVSFTLFTVWQIVESCLNECRALLLKGVVFVSECSMATTGRTD